MVTSRELELTYGLEVDCLQPSACLQPVFSSGPGTRSPSDPFFLTPHLVILSCSFHHPLPFIPLLSLLSSLLSHVTLRLISFVVDQIGSIVCCLRRKERTQEKREEAAEISRRRHRWINNNRLRSTKTDSDARERENRLAAEHSEPAK